MTWMHRKRSAFVVLWTRQTKRTTKGERKPLGSCHSQSLLVCLLLMFTWVLCLIEGVYSEREEVPDENWFIAHNKRAWHSLKAGVNYWIYPASKKLLPDPLPAPYQLRDTLLLEMSDVLCRPEWDKNNGWRAAMRPGLKQFLLAMSSYYEVVIFTTAPGHLGQPLSVVIDQLGCITYRLFREHTKFDNGKYLKDLSLLNRDLSNVILVDGNPDAYSLQPENGIIIKPWDGSAEDKELFRFTEFLEEIGIMAQVISGPDRNFDFRPLLKVLREIDPEDIPGAWKTHKERLRARFNEKEEEQQAQPTIVNSITNVLKQLVGKSAIRDGAAQVGKVSNLIDTIERIAETQKQQRALKLPEYEKRIAEAKKEQEKQALEPIQEMRDKNAKMIDYLTMQKQ
ncbi:HAD-like domain-containing protein [Gorgonomyces haynaldii]|nr:HAD-like domain-containing protein [Gorgonomyces haynaldii]